MRQNERATRLDLAYRLGRRQLLTTLCVISLGGPALVGGDLRSAHAKSLALDALALQQFDWRFCVKCEGLFFNGYPGKGTCAAGGGHAPAGYNFYLPHDIPGTPTAQADWRFCVKCEGLFFNGYPGKGTCAAGGAHQAAGYNFIIPHDIVGTPTAQTDWRFCVKCEGLFFNGYPGKGTCAAGGAHQAAGYNFVIPHDLPASLDFDFSPIGFDNGVPVGGFSHLTLRDDGSYTFSGHFHDSGATSYEVGCVWLLKDSQNMVYTFERTGHVYGTFEPGSRDYDWQVDSHNDELANRWANIAAGSRATAHAAADMDILGFTNALIGDLGKVVGVISILA
ncbi:MAG TPA: hypothetical protein VKR06_44730 [Ktedonosporobacter sp.]|nr:hypothetical protein [Ktedonosporobacter sp.]